MAESKTINSQPIKATKAIKFIKMDIAQLNKLEPAVVKQLNNPDMNMKMVIRLLKFCGYVGFPSSVLEILAMKIGKATAAEAIELLDYCAFGEIPEQFTDALITRPDWDVWSYLALHYPTWVSSPEISVKFIIAHFDTLYHWSSEHRLRWCGAPHNQTNEEVMAANGELETLSAFIIRNTSPMPATK